MVKTISVQVRNNVDRRQLTIDNDATVADVFKSAGVLYDGAQITLDGVPLTAREVNSPLNSITDNETITLMAIAKTANGMVCL